MSGIKICPICGNENPKDNIYCGNCGSYIFEETTASSVSDNAIYADEVTTKPKKTDDKKTKKKWYKPPPRTRPAYHPLEWFFWIGWSFYVLIRFIGIAIWYIIKEIGLFLMWCCWWGPPRELRKE